MDKKYIKTLLEKYLDGTTSEIEENLLADYFRKAGEDIPEEWEPYRALFAYINAEKETLQENHATPALSKPRLTMRRNILRRAAWIASAVCVLMIFALHHKSETPGNFAVIDGKVYTNSAVVKSEALDALQQVAFNEDKDLDALNSMIE